MRFTRENVDIPMQTSSGRRLDQCVYGGNRGCGGGNGLYEGVYDLGEVVLDGVQTSRDQFFRVHLEERQLVCPARMCCDDAYMRGTHLLG